MPSLAHSTDHDDQDLMSTEGKGTMVDLGGRNHTQSAGIALSQMSHVMKKTEES